MITNPRPADDVFVAYRFPHSKSKVVAMLIWVSRKKLSKLPIKVIQERVRFG